MKCYLRGCCDEAVCDHCEGCEEHCHCEELRLDLFDPDDMQEDDKPYFWNRL